MIIFIQVLCNGSYDVTWLPPSVIELFSYPDVLCHRKYDLDVKICIHEVVVFMKCEIITNAVFQLCSVYLHELHE